TRHFLGVRRWSAIAPGVRPSRSDTSSRVRPLRTKSTKASRSASGKAATSQCMTSVGRTHEQLDRIKALREADYRKQGASNRFANEPITRQPARGIGSRVVK